MDTETPTDEFERELARHVASLDREASYRPVRELKRADAEVTDLVMFEGASGGTLGPFVRKRIDARAQMGAVYERLFEAQRSGRRFAHLPRIVECRRADDELTVVMEYIDGETLGALTRRVGATPAHARVLFDELCRAAGELHTGLGAPIIHRDLKPSNIMVTGAAASPAGELSFSSLVIIDLGIARVWSDGAVADTVKFGTRAYAPPEQYGFGQTSVRSDVYALGGILFFCLTGRDPEPGRDMREQCRASGVPARLADVIACAMAFDPAQRYGSAEALRLAAAAAFSSAAPDRPAPRTRPPAPKAPPAPQPQPFESRHRASAAIARVLAPVGRLLAYVPESLGRIWNAVLYLFLAIAFAGCHWAVFHPTGENLLYPAWLLAVEYFLMVDPLFAAIAFMLLDKRRWRRRFPALERLRGARLVWTYLMMAAALMAVMVAVTVAANLAGAIPS